MIGSFQIRTDLALEAREGYDGDESRIRGVTVQEESDPEREIYTTVVRIETENGARAIGKPVGTYITLEAPNMSAPDEGYHREISRELSRHLRELMGERGRSVLVVGLGNREVTPDALGPNVVGNLRITRHMIREYGKSFLRGAETECVSAIVPGVMAQTGMETLEIVKGVVEETKPDLVIVIDALAARSTKRLNRTIQITDTGIHPGSGVGNHRNGINQEALGVPVIAVGVPTVVDAATIVNDTMEELVTEMDEHQEMQRLGGALGTLDSAQKHQMIRELISPHLNTMFVTPKDIDETVKYLSYTISEGLNIAFSEEETPENGKS
ncbi:MAG TPA: GPR endopeptidase [Candidatus Choladousia intestinavium]|uniref:Germination protease n=1 Tax=Candidatus Choladousia intestinavium TaxID=2840727 RepID=A0A9D1AB21_9FIRM|nr:GPR endopeptidase [Candidatus Choladousia intestinavium]